MNVFKNGTSQTNAGITLDHRGRAPSRNLFSCIKISNPYSASGNLAAEGVKAGQYETYWNINRMTKNWPATFGPAPKNIVGAVSGSNYYGDLWYEVMSNLTPAELHSAQLHLRVH